MGLRVAAVLASALVFGRQAPPPAAQIAQKVFDEINRVVHIIRPGSLLFLSVDGVAPLAKKQRAGRFAHRHDADATRAAVKQSVIEGGGTPEEAQAASSRVFDKNAISPGTAFMAQLGIDLQRLLTEQVGGTDAAWTGLRVIFSGHDVAGEGEVGAGVMVQCSVVAVWLDLCF